MPFNFAYLMDNPEIKPKQGSESPQQSGAGWIPAMQIFTEISSWIVVPIVLALIGGKALDKHFGTTPVLFLVLAGLGFLISAYGIVKSVKKYEAKMKKQDEEIK